MNKKNGIVSRENHPEFIDNAWRKITGWNEYYVHPTGFVKSIKINIKILYE